MKSFFFVFTSLMSSISILFALQIKVQGKSIEEYIIRWSQHSKTATFIRAKASKIGISFQEKLKTQEMTNGNLKEYANRTLINIEKSKSFKKAKKYLKEKIKSTKEVTTETAKGTDP